jgi:hypothetical protein
VEADARRSQATACYFNAADGMATDVDKVELDLFELIADHGRRQMTHFNLFLIK